MALQAVASLLISEEDVRDVAARLHLPIEDMSPAWFDEVIQELNNYLRDEKGNALMYAVQEVGSPENFPDIDHRRASAFCEWIKRKIVRINEYKESSGAHCGVYVRGMKDNLVAIEVYHGENPLDNISATGFVDADELSNPEIQFETLYKHMFA